MAKQNNSAVPAQDIDLQFPLEGVEITRAFARQRPNTATDAKNVVAFEPSTDRARGGQRKGQTKYLSSQIAGASYPVQDINHLITSSTGVALPAAAFAYAQASGSGFGIGSTTAGSSTFSGIGAVSGFALSCSCWDSNNNLYVAETNTSTGAVTIYQVPAGTGSPGWTLAGSITCLTGTLRGVSGMCVVGDSLYVAVIATNASYGSADNTCKIHKINAATGSLTLAAWQSSKITGTALIMYFSTAASNVLSSIGTVLAVDSCGSTTAGTQAFFLFDTTITTANGAPLKKTLYGGTRSGSQKVRVVSDGIANFYLIGSTTTGLIKKVGLNGVIAWQSTILDAGVNGLAFDYSTATLAALAGASNAVRTVNLTTGAQSASIAVSSTTWNEIGTDGYGNWVLWKNAQASNDIVGLSGASFTSAWGPTSFANATHSGCSVNQGAPQINPPGLNTRVIKGLAVSNGTLTQFSSTGTLAVTNGNVLSASARFVYSSQCGLNMFYCDGSGYFYYKSANNTLTAWTATTAGTIPVDPTLTGAANGIETWRGRIVLFGFLANPQLFYMAAQNDPFNWDFSPKVTTVTQAVAGNTDRAGFPGEVINTFIPYSDDTALFGGDHTIWQLTGDPAAGGQFDLVSRSLGIAKGRCWAIDTVGQVYFFSTHCGVYKMTPGALPVRISKQIEHLLDTVDLSANFVRMEWDVRSQGLHVWIVQSSLTGTTTHFFWEERVNAWWPVVYGNVAHNPRCTHVYDGDSPDDRVILLGGADGYIRFLDSSASNDDGTTISSFVILGPLPNRAFDEQMLMELQVILGDDSGDVTFSVYVGRTNEQALASTPVRTGTWTVTGIVGSTPASGRNLTEYIRRAGHAIYVKLSATSPWSLERIRAKYQPSLGMVRRRS